VRKKKIAYFIFGCFVLSLFIAAAEKSDLPERFREWLEQEVVYIIAPLEKEVFLQLKTDRERDLFIKAFWKHRDPTINIPENEFKTEHYSRISHVNHFYGRSSPKAGWRTDRGRIYIILGEPNDIQRFEGKSQVYNTEVWFYQGLTDKGLPPGFNLVFFQEGGIGEYRLYSPLGDGPQALMTSYFGDPANYLAAYQRLQEFEPGLAPYSMTLIPGEQSAVLGRPSMSSDILINRVESMPIREIEVRYARKFLEYKDLVEVEYSANYMDSDTMVMVTRDPSGLYFVHYSIEPKRLSVNQYQKKYYTTLKLNGMVVDKQGRTIYQFEKTIRLEFEEDRMKQISHRPLSIRDMFPLIPGEYNLTVLVKNEISKEFTTLESNLIIPVASDDLHMTSLLLGFHMTDDPPQGNRLRPFQTGRNRISFQPNRVFLRKDDLVVAFQIYGLTPEQRERAEIRYVFLRNGNVFRDLTRKASTFPDAPNYVESLTLGDFPPAHYRVHVSLILDGSEVLSDSDEFDVTFMDSIPRPWIYGGLLAGTHHPIYAYITGMQLFNSGRINESRDMLEKAYRADPQNADFALNLARFYIQVKDYRMVPPVLKPLMERTEPTSFEVFFLLGLSFQALGELAQAVEIFDQAMTHHGLSTNLLNAAGECYFQLGKMQEARVAWEKSLEINADQPEIRKSVEALKEKK